MSYERLIQIEVTKISETENGGHRAHMLVEDYSMDGSFHARVSQHDGKFYLPGIPDEIKVGAILIFALQQVTAEPPPKE